MIEKNLNNAETSSIMVPQSNTKKTSILLSFLIYTAVGSFLGLVSSKLLTYASRVLIARYAGPTEYGLYSLALAILGLITTVCLFGIPDTLSRFIPQLRKNNPAVIPYLKKTSLRYAVILGFLIAFLLFFFAPLVAQFLFKTPELTPYLRAFAFTIPLSMIATIYLVFLRSYEKIGWYSFIFNFVQSFSKLFFLLTFAFFFSYSFAIITSHVLAIIIVALFAGYLVNKIISFSSQKPTLRAKKYVLRQMSSFALPMMLYSLFNIGLYWTDTFMLGFYKTPLAVGLYNVALPLAALLALISEMFNQFFVPLLNRQYALHKFMQVRELSKQLSKWIMILNMFLLLLFLFYGEGIIAFLFGETYLSAYPALLLLSFAAFFSSLATIPINLLSMCNKPKAILSSISIAFVVNIFLNKFFIPAENILGYANETGLIGAALATLISAILVYTLLSLNIFFSLNFIALRRKGVFFSTILFILAMFTNTLLSSSLKLFIFLAFFLLAWAMLDAYDKTVIKTIKDNVSQFGSTLINRPSSED